MIDLGGRWELEGPDGTIVSWNDPEDQNFIGYLRDVSGVDSPAVRYSATDLPMADGAMESDAWYSARTIVLEGMLWPDPPALVNHRTEQLTRASNAMRNDCELRWWPLGKSPVMIKARRSEALRVRPGRPREFSLSLVAADPRIYSQDFRAFTRVRRSENGAWILDNQVECGNEGTAPAPWIARITGPITNPTLTNTTTNESIATTGLTISSGQTLIVDSQARTILLNGTTNKYANLNFIASSWFGIVPGPNEIELTGTGNDVATSLTVEYRAAWL